MRWGSAYALFACVACSISGPALAQNTTGGGTPPAAPTPAPDNKLPPVEVIQKQAQPAPKAIQQQAPPKKKVVQPEAVVVNALQRHEGGPASVVGAVSQRALVAAEGAAAHVELGALVVEAGRRRSRRRLEPDK